MYLHRGHALFAVVATRGIIAGAVQATREMRFLLIQWLDDTMQTYRHIELTVYVEDTFWKLQGLLSWSATRLLEMSSTSPGPWLP